MECDNCGASLTTSLICDYCGNNNSSSESENLSLSKDEIEFQIELLENKIRKLLSMPIPEDIKERKINLEKKKLENLKRKI